MRNLIFIIIIFLFGCTKRNLSVGGNTENSLIDIVYDWSSSSAGNMLLKSNSENDDLTFSIYLYGEDGSVIIRTSNYYGYSGTVPAGKYKMLIVAAQPTGVDLLNMNIFENTSAKATVLEKKNSVITLMQPSGLLSVNSDNIELKGGATTKIITQPVDICKVITSSFLFAKNSDAIKSCEVFIYGIAEGRKLTSNELIFDQSLNTRVFITDIVENSSSSSRIFGQRADFPNTLQMNVVYNDNSMQVLEVDITDALDKVEKSKNIDMTFFVDVSTDYLGGFNAKIKSWIIKEGDIII